MAAHKKTKKKVQNPDTRMVRINTSYGEDVFMSNIPLEIAYKERASLRAKEMTKNQWNNKQFENVNEAVFRRKKLESNERF